MRLVVRYICAFIGGFVAMSAHTYLNFHPAPWISAPRLGNAISAGLFFAHIVALMVIIARDIPQKPMTLRLGVGIIGGTLIGSLAWTAYLYLILFQANMNGLVVLFGGLGLTFGFVIASLLNTSNRLLNWGIASFITASAIYIPIFINYQAFANNNTAQALLYFDVSNPNHIYLIGLPFAITIAIFGNLPLLFNSSPHATTK